MALRRSRAVFTAGPWPSSASAARTSASTSSASSSSSSCSFSTYGKVKRRGRATKRDYKALFKRKDLLKTFVGANRDHEVRAAAERLLLRAHAAFPVPPRRRRVRHVQQRHAAARASPLRCAGQGAVHAVLVAHLHDRAHPEPLQDGAQDGRHVRIVLDDQDADTVETAGHGISWGPR